MAAAVMQTRMVDEVSKVQAEAVVGECDVGVAAPRDDLSVVGTKVLCRAADC